MARRILVPYDGSLHAHCALLEASRRALLDHRAVTLLAVAPEPGRGTVLDPALRDEARQDAGRLMHALLGQARAELPREVKVTKVVRHGDPTEQILKEIDSGDYELVVMGTRSRGAFHSMHHGSVALAVRLVSTVPVVLVPAVPWRERHWYHSGPPGADPVSLALTGPS